MSTEPFDFAGASGVVLKGRLDLPDGPARAFAVFAHCFACTKQSLAAVRIGRGLASNGIAVMRFDFTGLGESEGGEEYADTFTGNVGDVVAAARAMVAADRAPSLLIGHSLGGAAVLAAASQVEQVAAVATIGAPFDVEHVTRLLDGRLAQIGRDGVAEVDIGGRGLRVAQAFLEDLEAHEQDARISQLGRALLILHSPSDEVVGIGNASAVFQSAGHPKSFVALDGADHLLSNPADAEYVSNVIAAWAQPYLRAASLRTGP